MLDLNTTNALLAQNKISTQQMEVLTKQMTKLPQQLQVVQSSQNQSQLMSCDFFEVIIQMGSARIRIILHRKRLIIWAIMEGKEGSQVTIRIIICLKDGGAIKIKAFGGNRM